ncbi:hypothetical protein Mp_3g01670 [Marchantia polymorpha subsp. ruderalis]|uniref:HAT C-terminal dimerisation domain-containing protein n=2 Tax=Marchantia polymorpha TaxID=3197 RepID=A0AAF6AWE1_MARPO|nr:hypothetical protein MARPO_0007s0159 [Marchantia polymorpha]BBN04075.1 hypothetical protein Mp_3g01670 [Marchantia polymorpha subsp. ruderalis]|eukprot:PTQ47762.1 hypothetical protein MARPO_0007s0159 [Marchantia polymorpha]
MKAHEVKEELQKSLLEAEVLDHVVVSWPQKEQPSSNSIWDEFGPVVRICDNQRVECSTPYSWTSSRGTQSLRKHNCPPKSVAASSSHSIVQWARPNVQSTAAQKQMVVKSCAAMCAVDMRPYAIVSGEGFQSLLQTVLDIGVASKNPIRIKDLLSDEVTVKRAAVKTYQTIRQVLIAELQAHFQDKMDAGCTLDIWTEPLTSIAYMSVTMHYIDVNFKHNARTLQVDQFPEVSHTVVAILKTFKQCIISFTVEFDSMNGPRAAIPVVFPRCCINDFSSNDYDDDQDDIDSVPNTATLEILVIAELQAYEAFTLSKSEKKMMKETDEGTSGTEILLWWKSKASTWPILARAARSILAVPASSAMSENNFSDSGSTVSKKRN